MDEATEIVPFVHAAETHLVAETERHPFGEVDVVCDENALATRQPQDESLVPFAVIVIAQEANDDTGVLDPAAGIAFLIRRCDRAATPP